MNSYSFPILEAGELVATMKELIYECDISEPDFTRPKRERWERIYHTVLANATHCSVESFMQPQMEGLNALDHVELYEKSIPLFQLLRAMQKLMITCFVDDFNIADIIEPKSSRLRKICSALVNYMRFLSERLPVLHRIKEDSEALVEQREILTKENNELQIDINNLKATRSEREPEINQLKEKITVGTSRLEELQSVVQDKQRESNDVKTAMSEAKSKLAKIKADNAEAKTESNRLSGLIVQSPERMKSEMDRMQSQLNKLKREKDEKMKKLVDMRRMKELFTQKQQDCEQALKLLNDVSDQSDMEKKVLGEIGNTRDQSQLRKEQLSNIQIDEKQQKRILTTKQEKLAKMTLQHEAKVSSFRDDITAIQSQIAAEDAEMMKVQSVRQKLCDEETQRVHLHEKDMHKLGDKYSVLLQQLGSYHNRLGESWEDLQTVL